MSDEPREHPPTEHPPTAPLPVEPEVAATAPVAPAARGCPEGVPPEDVAAWAVDGAAYGPLELAEHVPSCPACRGVVASLDRAAGLGDTLRGARDVRLPEAVVERALGRVRAERAVSLLLGTLGGAFARVAASLPDLVARRGAGDREVLEPGRSGPPDGPGLRRATRRDPDRG
jgi:hypothetical protein